MNARVAVAACVLALTAGAAVSQAQQARVGMHGGYEFEMSGALIGAQLHVPMGRSWELYPSLDYYFAEDGNVVGFNGDILFRMAEDPLYLGGGLNVMDPTDGGSDAGFSLFGGFESRRLSGSNPYIELRGLFHDEAAFQITMGINFTLQ